MAKKWRKKKNTLPYFARIDAGPLDVSDGLVADLLVNTNEGKLQDSWPIASLQDLQDFLSKLVSDVVRAGSGPIQLGNIDYFEQNAKGKPEETGLSWDSPFISSDFENFVVSTANDLFNSQSTRQDEGITYDMICEALDALQKAALTYTSLTADDMPVYPTAKAFQQARNTGEDVAISSKRLTLKAQPPIEEKETPVKASVSEPLEEPVQPVPVQESKAAISPETDDSHSDPVEAPQTEVHPIEKILSQVHLTVPYFDLAEAPKDNVPASDAGYVANQMNLYKQETNQFLNVTKETFLAKIGEGLSKQTEAEQQRHEEALAKLNDAQWENKLEKRLATEKAQESKQLFHERQQGFKAQYDRSVAQENQRHEQALQDLQVTFQNQLDAVRPQIDAELNAWYEKRNHELHETYREQLKELVTETKQLQAEQLISSLSKTANELVAKFNDHLAKAQEKTTDELERRRQIAQQEHERAVRLENQAQQTANQAQSLADLQGQVGSLNAAVHQVTNERDEEHQQYLAAQDRYERLNEQLVSQANQPQTVAVPSAGPSSDNTALIKAYEELLEEKMRNASLANSHSQQPAKGISWKSGIVALTLLVLVGGVGTLVVTQQQLSANYQSLAKENQELKNGNTQKTTASSSASSSSASSASSIQQVDRPYAALDDSLKRNSLDIYRQSFADNQLGDNSYRVFRVGQLLNQQVGRDEAVAVAKANPGYNQTLNQYLGI